MPTPSDLLAYDLDGPSGATSLAPLLLVHAGVADGRMWDPVVPTLARDRVVIRPDLRGFGDSDRRPDGPLDPVADLATLLHHLDVNACDIVGASFGAGVAVELALSHPDLARSLLLAAPGGSLLTARTADFAAFAAAEGEALERGDLDAATAANVRWWVVGPGRDTDEVDSEVRDAVARMQRRAFEIDMMWTAAGASQPAELDPPAADRLREIAVPTTVLVGTHDLETVRSAATRVAAEVPGAVLVVWDDVAHLPSMEQPDRFVQLVRDRASSAE